MLACRGGYIPGGGGIFANLRYFIYLMKRFFSQELNVANWTFHGN